MTMLGAGGGEWVLLEDVRDLADWAEMRSLVPRRTKWVEEFVLDAQEAQLESLA